MSDPRLDDLGRRIRAAEKKFASHILSHTSREIEKQIAATGRGIAHVRVEMVDGRYVVGPAYPGASS